MAIFIFVTLHNAMHIILDLHPRVRVELFECTTRKELDPF